MTKYLISRYLIIIIFILIFTSGCSRYIDYAKKTFCQAQIENINIDQARKLIRSAKLYDQFTTVSLCDALLLDQDTVNILNSLNNKNNNYIYNPDSICFYLLINNTENNSPDSTKILWDIYLKINNIKIFPQETVKLQELEPEVAYIFSNNFIKFRDIYKLVFNIKSYNIKNICKIELCLRSVKYIINLEWD